METIRGMVPLQNPFARPAIAAAFEFDVPARSGDEAETIAAGASRADAPSAPLRARTGCCRRAKEQQRQAGRLGCEMQPSARLEVGAPRQTARHRRGRRGANRLFHCPKGRTFVPGLDQDQAAGIEAEILQAMTVQLAAIGEYPRRADPEQGAFAVEPAEQSQKKANS